jgi:hypothetical protein
VCVNFLDEHERERKCMQNIFVKLPGKRQLKGIILK